MLTKPKAVFWKNSLTGAGEVTLSTVLAILVVSLLGGVTGAMVFTGTLMILLFGCRVTGRIVKSIFRRKLA